MLLDGAGELVEMFKSSFPLSFLFFVPLFILISPVSRASAAHDFAVHRMQQYDLQGASHGRGGASHGMGGASHGRGGASHCKGGAHWILALELKPMNAFSGN